MPGYSFDTAQNKRASYFCAMESLGLINEQGCDLSIDRWLDSSFILPFRISPDFNTYSPEISERILQEPVVSHGKYKMFLEFDGPTTYVIR